MAKIVIGFLLIGVLGVWMFLGFSHYVVFMLSPFLAPFVVPWAARTQERLTGSWDVRELATFEERLARIVSGGSCGR
ncbi:hypothetical protein ACXC9Q_13780 [Kribbella sp. CWNU-51]